MRTVVNALYIFHAVIHDRRFDIACNARYADHSLVSIEFCGKHIASFDLQHDGSNAIECVLHALQHSPLRNYAKAYSLRINTLGKRAVYSIAVVDASNFECYGVKHVRTSHLVADALLNAEQEGTLKTIDAMNSCAAYISSTRYNKRVWLTRP